MPCPPTPSVSASTRALAPRPPPRARWMALVVSGAVVGATAAQPVVPAPGAPWPVGGVVPGFAPSRAARPDELRADAPLSLAALSDFALRHHPATREAWAAALADLAGVDAARALLRPAITLSVPASIAHASDVPATADAAAAPASTTRSIAASASLGWVLFDFGARADAVDAARWQAAASALAYDRVLQEVVGNVEETYYAKLDADELLAATTTSTAAARASLDAVQARRHAGLATLAEAAQAEAALAQAQLATVQADAQARSASGALASALGLSPDVALTIAGGAPAAAPAARVDELLATARVTRADLLASTAQVAQGRALAAAAQAQDRPTLSLAAQATRQWTSPGSAASTQQLGLVLSVPLFDGGLVRAQTRAARARLDQLEQQRDVTLRGVELEVWQSFQAADSTEAAMASASALLRSATIAEDGARSRYGAGVGSLVELLVAQATAAQARASAVQVRYDAALALARLGRAVGARVATR